MEFRNKAWILEVESNSKNIVSFDPIKNEIKIDDLSVSYPGEYEKSGILLEVKDYQNNLFYSFAIDWIHVFFILADEFELKEEIISFFGDVDVLVILWTKKSVKIFENVEARVVIPYWEGKDLFLQTLGQNIPEVSSYKTKWEFGIDNTEFVNLAN